MEHTVWQKSITDFLIYPISLKFSAMVCCVMRQIVVRFTDIRYEGSLDMFLYYIYEQCWKLIVFVVHKCFHLQILHNNYQSMKNRVSNCSSAVMWPNDWVCTYSITICQKFCSKLPLLGIVAKLRHAIPQWTRSVQSVLIEIISHNFADKGRTKLFALLKIFSPFEPFYPSLGGRTEKV